VAIGGVAVDVGVRKLRDRLRHHLAEVRSSRVLTVTDHGRPNARIVPVGRLTRLEQLRAEGRVQQARTRKQRAPTPVTPAGTVSDLVGEQRR
jgi:prevent-host-death family protein